MGIILASGSPRRRELLEMLGLEFEIRPAKGGEHPPEGAGPEETVLALAGAKAEARGLDRRGAYKGRRARQRR